MDSKIMEMMASAMDSTRVIESGRANPKGMKTTLNITQSSSDLIKGITVLKSDVSTVTIKEVDLEEAPGVGRLFTLEVLLEEMTDKLRRSNGMFPLDALIKNLESYMEGKKNFTMIIDDPLALSQFLVPPEFFSHCEVKEENYTRTWDQDDELGLLKAKNNESEAPEDSVQKLVELIRNAKSVTGFTGAGVSVESGVHPYRGGDANSIWTKYDPEIANIDFFMASHENRIQHWKMKSDFYDILSRATPNPSHNIFAYLEKEGKLNKIVTQNIDGLHEQSGVPEHKIIHLHGTAEEANCLHCLGITLRPDVHDQLLGGKEVPECSACGGPLRPSTVLFGEKLNPDSVEEAKKSMRECDLLLVIGSSLVVQPANRLPAICLERGIPVVIINKEGETQYDKFVDLLIKKPSGETMAKVLKELEGR